MIERTIGHLSYKDIHFKVRNICRTLKSCASVYPSLDMRFLAISYDEESRKRKCGILSVYRKPKDSTAFILQEDLKTIPLYSISAENANTVDRIKKSEVRQLDDVNYDAIAELIGMAMRGRMQIACSIDENKKMIMARDCHRCQKKFGAYNYSPPCKCKETVVIAKTKLAQSFVKIKEQQQLIESKCASNLA